MNIISRLTVFISLILLASFCGLVKTQHADMVYGDKWRGNDNSTPEFEDDEYLYEIGDKFGLMALFAYVSYRHDLPKDKLKSACSYLDKDKPLPTYGMPYLLSSDTSSSDKRWSRWRGSTDKKFQSEPCCDHEKSGLFDETYVYTSKDKIQEAVIAFRGTENKRAPSWHDWKSNFAAFFGFEPEQYKIVSENIPKVIEALKNENEGIEIYVTGHSLGGGLAQQAGYLSKDIKEVFTFNTSPVTNWSSLSIDGKVENAWPIIHRIYNGGDVLGRIRSVSTHLTKARYGRHDIGIQVKPKQPFAGHSMALLTRYLACLIEDKNKIAQHYFSPKYIQSELMVKDGICAGIVDFGKCDLIRSIE